MTSKYVIVNREDTIIEELKNANQNLQTVNESVNTADTNNQAKLDILNTSVNTADTNNQEKLDTLNTSVSAADTNNQQKLETLNDSVNTADANNVSEFNELQELQKYSNEQLDNLGVKTSTIIAQTQQIDADLLAQTNKLDVTIKTADTNNKQKLDTLNTSVNTADTNNQQKLDTLNTSVSTADTNNQAKLDTVNGSVQAVKEEAETLNATLLSLEGLLSGEAPAQTGNLEQIVTHFDELNNSILVSEKDGQTETVISVLNKILESLPSISSTGSGGGLKKVVLEDGEFIGQHVYDITPYYPTLAFIHIKMNTVISDTSGTAEGKLDIVMYPPFNRSYRYIYKDGEYVSEDVIRYRVNSTRKLYYYPYVGTMTSSDLQIILLLQGTLKDSTENEYYLYSGTTATVELYYFDSTPVDTE